MAGEDLTDAEIATLLSHIETRPETVRTTERQPNLPMVDDRNPYDTTAHTVTSGNPFREMLTTVSLNDDVSMPEESLTEAEVAYMLSQVGMRREAQAPVQLTDMYACFERSRWPALKRTWTDTNTTENAPVLPVAIPVFNIDELRCQQPTGYVGPRFINPCNTLCWLNSIIQVIPPPHLAPSPTDKSTLVTHISTQRNRAC